MFKTISFFVVLLIFSSGIAQENTTLTVTISEIKDHEGILRVGLYNSEGSWLNKVAYSKSHEINADTETIVFENIPFGTYAISLYNDENRNNELDMYLGFYPKEKYACSNGATGQFGPPKWAEAKFIINSENTEIKVKF